ncbi:MAG: PilZ domain-containing protein [Spirochaetota bacterium]
MIIDFLSGFSASPVEIVAFVLVIAVLISFLIWYASRTRRRERRRRVAIANRRYEEMRGELALSNTDAEALERLSHYLRKPEQKPLLLQNHTVFNDCAERALADDTAGSGEVAALRVRLGFGGSPAGAQPESSTEIPAGSGVIVIDNHDRMISGRVREPTPSAFRIDTDRDAPRVTTGTFVEVVHQNGSGIYQFGSAVLSNPPGEMTLSHAEGLRRVQRRRYYRGNVRLPVYVKLASESERPAQTELIDIGGGGASFFAPDGRYQRGEHVELTFHPDSTKALHLPGRIERESKGGKVVHVSFEDLRPATRDKVVGLVFRNERRRETSEPV